MEGWGDFPAPRFGTPLSGRPNRLALFERLAGFLGWELMGWQRYVLSVASEVEDGMPVYRWVTVTCPRRNGKTTVVVLPVLAELLMGAVRRVVYSCQSISDGKALWEREVMPVLRQSVLWDEFGLGFRRALGDCGLWAEGGGFVRILGKSESAGTGSGQPLVVYDECWAFADDAREVSLSPSQRTFPDAQTWWVSTVGGDLSVGWHERIARCREIVESGRSVEERTAFFEWSAGDEDDISDRRVWVRANPAVGRTFTMQALEDDRANYPDEFFRRTVLNQLPSVGVSSVFPPLALDRVEVPDLALGLGEFREVGKWVGLDGHPFGDWAGISWAVAGGVDFVERVVKRRAVSWILELADAHEVAGVVGLRGGPVDVQLRELERRGMTVLWVGQRERMAMCSGFVDAVVGQQVEVGRDTAIREAAGSAIRKVVGTGGEERGFIWTGVGGVEMFPLWSLAMAWYGAQLDAWTPRKKGPVVFGLDDADSDLADFFG